LPPAEVAVHPSEIRVNAQLIRCPQRRASVGADL
jgi:hypothetical protein